MTGLAIIAAVGWVGALIIGYHWYHGRLRIDDLADTLATRDAELAEAIHVGSNALTEAEAAHADLNDAREALALAESLKADSDGELTKMHIRAARTFALPTIEGSMLDAIAAMQPGDRIDFGAPDNPPLFAETLAGSALAPVVPIKKRAKK